MIQKFAVPALAAFLFAVVSECFVVPHNNNSNFLFCVVVDFRCLFSTVKPTVHACHKPKGERVDKCAFQYPRQCHLTLLTVSVLKRSNTRSL